MDDGLGTLNRLTDDLVLKAAKQEIQTGIRISLNWPLDAQSKPLFGRQGFHKTIYHRAPRIVNDDVWTFNTQSSSQWDGLRHFAYQKEQKFNNGVSMEDIHGEHKSDVNGIHAWAEKGIVGRGVLLGFDAWRHAKNIPYEPFRTGSITLKQLKAVAAAQGTDIKFGDVLLIRSAPKGYVRTFGGLSEAEIEVNAREKPPLLSGEEQSEDVLE
ncbi:Kynurenine formamidase [Lasallia pustulata]|uniref:Kynurenine formamidase n=1 Tax=Lasallia pustulata TaxID=136370 RepID=A0A1W5D636_9LECA|nr:Kynurenine formamidase [Lasallia pustulata]